MLPSKEESCECSDVCLKEMSNKALSGYAWLVKFIQRRIHGDGYVNAHFDTRQEWLLQNIIGYLHSSTKVPTPILATDINT